MVCHPCTKKWKQYYLSKGFNEKQAENMAHKLVMRVEARQRKEQNRIRYLRMKSLLYKWTFIINIRATILQSFLHHHLLWVGRTYNPDYTLACTGTSGDAWCNNNGCEEWVPPKACISSCSGGTCACQAPLSNSHQISNGCGQVYTGLCYCRLFMGVHVCWNVGAYCSCGGTCGYNCDTGYAWNGSACVPVSALVKPYGDGLIWIID